MKNQKILPEFQDYLLARQLATEKNVAFYALWASKFIAFNNGNEQLPLEVRIDQFLRDLQAGKPLADWQLGQAEQAGEEKRGTVVFKVNFPSSEKMIPSKPQ